MSGLTKDQLTGLRALVASVPARTGFPRQTLGHEPKNQPGKGITCSVFLDAIDPITSGLAATSLRVSWFVRLQTPMIERDEDDIDMELGAAAVAVMAGYAGGFRFADVDPIAGVDIRGLDLRGMEGVPMSAPFGYFDHDGVKFRAVAIVVPLLINDVLTEAP